LVLLGEVFTVSQSLKTPAHQGDESLEFVVVGEAMGLGVVGQAPESGSVGYSHASPGLAQVA